MSKDELRKAAEQLIEAERLCRNAYEQSGAGYEAAYNTVKDLTEHVRAIQQNVPEVSAKQYWWDTPFSPEAPKEERFCFDEGEYCEADPIRIIADGNQTTICQKTKRMDYSSLSLDLTLGTYIPLFVNKKQLRSKLNESMECRYIYNASVLRYEAENVPDLTRGKESSADIWRQYRELEGEKRAEHREYLKSHDETWDRIEKVTHGSLFTNEERWFMGKMDTNDYLNESIFRESFALDKEAKMNEELHRVKLQATKVSQEVRQRQMEERRNALRGKASRSRVRMIPVGHIVYCGDEIMAIFLHEEKESVVEFECPGDVSLESLGEQRVRCRVTSNQKPALYPAVWDLARVYKNVLPAFSVLSVRPANCPEEIWREWIAARWEHKNRD